MIEYPYDKTDNWLVCSCCGAMIANNRHENVALHEPEGSPYPCDEGRGYCVDCFGDPSIDPERSDDEGIKAALGFAGRVFYDTRIEAIANKLTGTRLALFLAWPYVRQIRFVQKRIEKGRMI